MVGGTICIISESDRTNDLAKAINVLDANWIHLTATVASLIQPPEVPCIKTLLIGGESPTEGIVSTWAGKVNLVNSYGMSDS